MSIAFSDRAGGTRLTEAEEVYLGIDAAALIDEAQRFLGEERGELPRIELHF